MDEPYNKTYGGGKWWVDQCGWGRRFDTEASADTYIAAMQALTPRKPTGRLVFTKRLLTQE